MAERFFAGVTKPARPAAQAEPTPAPRPAIFSARSHASHAQRIVALTLTSAARAHLNSLSLSALQCGPRILPNRAINR